jgi:hypothetical protein
LITHTVKAIKMQNIGLVVLKTPTNHFIPWEMEAQSKDKVQTSNAE